MRFDHHEGRIVVELLDESGTDDLGLALARSIGAGRVVGLVGDLGAGKTRLTRGFAQAMGVDPATIASPTFVLIHEYAGRLPIYHFDAYRLAGPDDFDSLGAAEYFASGGICVVEWADLVLDRLPADTWMIRLTSTGPTSRVATIEGPDLAPLVEALGAV